MADNAGAAADLSTNDSPSSGEDAAMDFFTDHVSASPAGKTGTREQGRTKQSQRPAARQPDDDEEGDADLDGLEADEGDLDEEALDDEGDEQDDPDTEDEGDEGEEGEEQDDEAAEEGAEAGLHRIIVDGKPHHVTLKEMRELASQGLNFTQKSQVTAEELRTTRAEREQTKAERANLIRVRGDYATRLQELGEAMDEAIGGKRDWAKLRQEDPEAFRDEYADYQLRKEQRERVTAEQERVRLEQQNDFDTQRQTVLQGEKEKLLEAIPEWRDEKVRRNDFRSITRLLTSVGYTAQDLAQVTDHRLVLLLRKAAKMTALEKTLPPKKGTKQGKQAKVVDTSDRRGEKRLTQTPRNERGEFIPPRRKPISPTVRPSGMRPVVSQTSRLRQRLAETHAEEDAVPLFSKMLADEERKARRR